MNSSSLQASVDGETLNNPIDKPQNAIEARNLSAYYGEFRAVKDVNLQIKYKQITAIIGPSGCGKSTVLRSFNRMNELVPRARVEGQVLFHGQNIYADYVDPVLVRKRIGMVFQKPNPFPKSIYENVAWGARINGFKGNMDELVEKSLHSAAFGMRSRINSTRAGFRSPVASSNACASPEQ